MDFIMDYMTYIKPELMVMVPVCYLIGTALKKASFIKDKYIPATLMVMSIVVCLLYLSVSYPGKVMLFFAAIIQGVLTAGCAVFGDQLIKQNQKDE